MTPRILLIDNDDHLRASIALLLIRSGYEVVEAGDGQSAMRMMLRLPADLVVTDMIMPEMDGVETIRALRRLYPWVKILAISGGGVTPAENHLKVAHALGAHKVMAKPLIPEEFLDAVGELLKRHEGRISSSE